MGRYEKERKNTMQNKQNKIEEINNGNPSRFRQTSSMSVIAFGVCSGECHGMRKDKCLFVLNGIFFQMHVMQLRCLTHPGGLDHLTAYP